MAVSSKVAFTAALRDMELSILAAKFDENGWGTFEDFAFSTSDPSGRDTDMFEKQVLAELLAADGSQKKLIPKIRRLYAQAYVHATALMTEEAIPKGIDERVSMHPADRAQRTEDLRARLFGFTLAGPNMPSTTLTDKFATMLKKGIVKYVSWDECTSHEQEL